MIALSNAGREAALNRSAGRSFAGSDRRKVLDTVEDYCSDGDVRRASSTFCDSATGAMQQMSRTQQQQRQGRSQVGRAAGRETRRAAVHRGLWLGLRIG